MGISYLTDLQKQTLNNEFNNLHATFARPITIFKTAQRVVIATSAAHNILFDGSPTNSETTETIESGVFQARILYGKKQSLEEFRTTTRDFGTDQPVARLSDGDVRLKLDPTGAAFIAGAARVQFDSKIFDVETDNRPHGLFNPNFQTFYLKLQQ